MYRRDGSVREMSWDRKGPSFSSTLLDEINRSIDEGTARKDCNGVRKKQQQDEEVMQRSKLLDKWMKKKLNSEENSKRSKMEFDNDALFFSSGSNSSDSTNSSLFSEHESITVKTRSSCFLPPKPIRTSKKTDHHCCSETELDVPASAKSRALKLYAHLKKMKQPISPGVKLTAFINSILSNSKKHSKRETTAASKPTCSSASSFTRSCLKQQTTSSRRVDYIKPFVPVNAESVTLKRDERQLHRRQPIDSISNRVSPKPNSIMQSKPVSVAEDEEDAASECSEDLFELDHLKLSGVFSAELPVYETTQVRVPSRVSHKDSNM